MRKLTNSTSITTAATAAAVKPAAKASRKLAGSKPAAKKPVAADKPVAAPAVNPPATNSLGTAAPTRHADVKLTYAGPSPTVRGHNHKLTPIAAPGTKTFGNVTVRDESFIRDMREAYGNRAFARLDCDCGNVNRAVYHGFLEIVSGELASRQLQLRVTPRGLAYGNNAKPAKA